jgi:hypothetical protein
VCKITKNTLMRIAVDGDENWQPMTEFLKDSSAFLLIKDDLGGAIKEYQAFQKETKKTVLRGGVMEGQALTEDQVKAITELPTKEELMARLAGAINAMYPLGWPVASTSCRPSWPLASRKFRLPLPAPSRRSPKKSKTPPSLADSQVCFDCSIHFSS